jgi:hypothetical protein
LLAEAAASRNKTVANKADLCREATRDVEKDVETKDAHARHTDHLDAGEISDTDIGLEYVV